MTSGAFDISLIYTINSNSLSSLLLPEHGGKYVKVHVKVKVCTNMSCRNRGTLEVQLDYILTLALDGVGGGWPTP